MDYSYIGVGKFYLRESGSAAPLVAVGNASALALNVTEDVKELRDFTQPGGGTYNEVRRVAAVELAITIHDLSPENLAIALRGITSANSVTPVVDEPHTAYVGGLIPTNKPATDGTIVVKEGVTALTEGVDYELTPGGILVLGGGSPAAVTDGDTLLISYTPAASNALEALLEAGQEYEVYFAGLNEARSGKAFNVHGYRWRPGPAANLALIGDDYAGLELTGKLLKDTTKDGVSVSQYFKAQAVT